MVAGRAAEGGRRRTRQRVDVPDRAQRSSHAGSASAVAGCFENNKSRARAHARPHYSQDYDLPGITTL